MTVVTERWVITYTFAGASARFSTPSLDREEAVTFAAQLLALPGTLDVELRRAFGGDGDMGAKPRKRRR